MISRMHSTPAFTLFNSDRAVWWLFVATTLVMSSVSVALAGPREQAERIHNRLAGVPPTDAVLTQMASDIQNGGASGPIVAANIAMDDPHFYTVTLKNWAAPWTNRDQSAFVPLNDYITLVMGMVRDNVPFNQILTGDILYYGNEGFDCAVGHEQPALRRPRAGDASAELQSDGRAVVDDAVGHLRHSVRGDRGRDHDARGGRGVLRRGHQPRDVPLHVDQPPVRGHGAGARHEHHSGSDPAGRVAQPRRRQPRVLEQLHRLPRRHGSARAGVRVLRLQRDDDADRIHARRRATEVLQQQRDVRRRIRDAGRLLEQPLAAGPERADRLELGIARLGQRREVARPRARRARTRSRSARSRRSSKRCACALRAIRRTATRSTR